MSNSRTRSTRRRVFAALALAVCTAVAVLAIVVAGVLAPEPIVLAPDAPVFGDASTIPTLQR